MAEFPALPIFTDAFISDTTHLTSSQTGAYIMLMFVAWRTKENALPDDDKKLSLWSRMGLKAWNSQKEVIMAFWKKGQDGLWHQSRLDDERKRAEDIKSRNSSAGKASALKRQGRHSTSVDLGCNQTSTPSPIPSPTVESKKDSPLPPNPPEVKNVKPKRSKPTNFIAETFGGDIKSMSLAADLGLDFNREQRKFIDHYLAKGEARADWQASFRTWLNHAAEYRDRDAARDASKRSNVRDVTGAALRVIALHKQAQS